MNLKYRKQHKHRLDTSDFSSQLSEYQSSIDSMAQRLEHIEEVAFRNFEAKFSHYKTFRQKHVSLLEQEIEILKGSCGHETNIKSEEPQESKIER